MTPTDDADRRARVAQRCLQLFVRGRLGKRGRAEFDVAAPVALAQRFVARAVTRLAAAERFVAAAAVARAR